MHLELKARHALLLQGPVGPFFRRFGDELRGRGMQVTKVNFNAGDALFYPGGIAYRDRLEEWPVTFRKLVKERCIDAVFLFGDCRPIHKPAIRIAGELGIPVWVFEEGYLRPNHITLERGGANGHSGLTRDPDFYRRATAELAPIPDPIPLGNTFPAHAFWTALHSVATTFFCWRYPHYRHHRNVNSFWQTFCWLRGGVRKYVSRLTERHVLARLGGARYFFVPLQVYCDASLEHSNYASMEEFIDEVVTSFVAHAPADHLLVLKHHPHDLPYRDYGAYLGRYDLGERLVYVHDLHLPTLLKHARGVVTMNSTVGLSSLFHKTPVKVTGRAVYDVPGLTCQRPLADFFRDPGTVDLELFECFCRYLRETNQINGSFYKRARALGTVSGLALPAIEVGSEGLLSTS